jgi:5-methylcytosine-specific restriction endonuclease McrA
MAFKDTETYIWQYNLTKLLIEKYNGLCQLCKTKRKRMHLHHKDYTNVNINTVMYLCSGCHKFIHSTGENNVNKIVDLINKGKRNYQISNELNIPVNRILRFRKRLS